MKSARFSPPGVIPSPSNSSHARYLGSSFSSSSVSYTHLDVYKRQIPKTGFFDYANKYQDGGSEEICPANISEEISQKMQELTVRAFHALKLNVYSRADFLLDENDNLYCLEVNTLPGMTAASLLPKEAKAVGIEYGDLCELIIQKSLEARYQ